ncbi:MAG: class I SAM-dependent methyltransferase [Candidatus Curtissbacteria bacterium]|nr:class I SAM-dependent methyltransferase [Candidatus Curtissbacteria bacterium]
MMIPFYESLRPLILPLSQIDSLLPKQGTIVELGCGQAVIAIYLAKNKKRKVIGVDQDTSRLPKNSTKNLKFINADIRTYKLEKADGVVISDVLHHISSKDQEKILQNIANSLRKGKILIIKEIDTEEKVRSKLSRLWDFILYPRDHIDYWSSSALKSQLERLGFRVEIKRTIRPFPASTTLFICIKM